jgi:multidrug efflux pump subunit AcrA (membrane-fusion protein)
MTVSIWGRLFVWVAVLAGSLLIVVIVALIIQFGRRGSTETGSAVPGQDEVAAVGAGPAAGLVGAVTYHPAEVAVQRLAAETHYQQWLEFPGRVRPKRSTRLGFELGGPLLEPRVEIGQAVAAGQVLAEVDTRLLREQGRQLEFQVARAAAMLAELTAGPRATTIRAAEAEVAALAAEAESATNRRVRQAELVRQGAVSEQEFDTVLTAEQAILKRLIAAEQRLAELQEGSRPEQIAAQQALVSALQSEQASLKLQIEKGTLVAPFAGAVVKQYAATGQVLGPGQALFDLVETAALEAHIGVSPEVAAQMKLGQTYTLWTDQRSSAAGLERIVPIVDPQTQTVTAIFGLQPGEDELDLWMPGRLVRLRWRAEVAEAGYWVPNDALVRGRRGLWAVYELAEEPQVASRTTDVGAAEIEEPLGRVWSIRQQQVEVLHAEQQRSYVRGTLTPQAWVVVAGGDRLLDGQRVAPTQVIPAGEAAADGGR